MAKSCDPREADRVIPTGTKVRIAENAEEDGPDTQDETLVRSPHAGEEGKYIEDIITQCKVRFAIVELADGSRVLVRKQYVDPVLEGKKGAR